MRKILEVIGVACIAKVLFKAGEQFGEFKAAAAMIRKESHDLKEELKNRRDV